MQEHLEVKKKKNQATRAFRSESITNIEHLEAKIHQINYKFKYIQKISKKSIPKYRKNQINSRNMKMMAKIMATFLSQNFPHFSLENRYFSGEKRGHH